MMDFHERRELLQKLAIADTSIEQLAGRLDKYVGDVKDEVQLSELQAQIDSAEAERQLLLECYKTALPVRSISRCPFTGEVLHMAIDDAGLDGPWWDYDTPIRPNVQLPSTYFAMDGALRIGGNPEKAPFVCCPGPDIPFVIPRLLSYVQIKAVLSTIKIGEHTAYPIFYYADPMPYGIKRQNDWGTGRYWESEGIADILSSGQYIGLAPDTGEYDFNLEPWIRAGKLLWIVPDDEKLRLHGHTSYCPYLGLIGSRKRKYIENGEINEEEEIEFMNMDAPDFDMEQFMNTIEKVEEGK